MPGQGLHASKLQPGAFDLENFTVAQNMKTATGFRHPDITRAPPGPRGGLGR
jgi:hypothetical protein